TYTLGLTSTPCTGVAFAPSPASPQAIGTTVTWTASATGCGSPEYLITVIGPSATWNTPQHWSPNAVFTWTTTGLASGDYLFEVQAPAPASFPTRRSSDLTYTLGLTSTPCTGVAFAPSPASPQAIGTTVTWTASATGCGSPEYLIT